MTSQTKSPLTDYVTTKDVANRFGVKVRDVQYYIKNGRIEAERVGDEGYFYLIHRSNVPKTWPPS